MSPNPSPTATGGPRIRVPRPSPEYPRQYLSPKQGFSAWAEIRPVVEELRDRPVANLAELMRWIRDWNEFGDAIGEEGNRLYIEMTCDTRDPAKEKAYLAFVEGIEPELAPATDALNRKLLAHPAAKELPAEYYGKWLESVRVGVELFREENVPLQTELSKLSQSYQKICGEMTVEWEGQVKTLSQLAPYLQESDRALREKAWRAMAERRLKDADRLDALYDEMLGLRNRIAANLGLKDYVEYAFKSNLRTDYGPEDCFRFHATVEEAVVPRYREILARRREKMGLDRLRPWDLACDPLGRPPLKPFAATADLVDGVERIFRKLDPELHAFYLRMVDQGLLDLENRVGKAPGGYQSSLSEVRLPFIFMNAVGLNEDVYTLLHESGHAFHAFYTRGLDLGFNRHAPMEFSEVASMSMERLGARHLAEFYGPEELRRSVQGENEEVFRLLPWVATIDAFQHWIYAHPGHQPADRSAYWRELDARFGPGVDWTGLEEYRDRAWQRQLHIFEVPFYYIEYGIAQLGALQVWRNSLADPREALKLYKRGLRLGGTCGLRQLFAAAGLRFDLSGDTVRPLVDQVWEEWRQAAGA